MRLFKLIAFITLAFAATAYLKTIVPIGRKLEPATPQNSRVDMLLSSPDAIILSSFVTGDVPRLIRGDSLEAWSDALWFTNNVDVGNMLGAALLGMGGMPPLTHIGTAFDDGIPTESFSCLTVNCINWPTTETTFWGLGTLQGQKAVLGAEVHLERQIFTEYSAYLDAHARVMSDPFQWLTEEGAEIPQPDTDGLRLLIIALPTRLVHVTQAADFTEENRAIANELTTLANNLIDGLGGKVQAIHGSSAKPLWVSKDDKYLRDVNGGTRSLPGYVTHHPVIRLKVPNDAIATVQTRLAGTSIPSADLSVLDGPIADAFDAWGIDTDCLPQCGGVIPATEFQVSTEMDIAGAPFWTLSFWRLPPS